MSGESVVFDGDLGKAQARLRKLADEATRALTTTQLNMLSAMMAGIMSDDHDDLQSINQIAAECKAERAEMQKTWEAMGGEAL